jgi:hypothetical protein
VFIASRSLAEPDPNVMLISFVGPQKFFLQLLRTRRVKRRLFTSTAICSIREKIDNDIGLVNSRT